MNIFLLRYFSPFLFNQLIFCVIITQNNRIKKNTEKTKQNLLDDLFLIEFVDL